MTTESPYLDFFSGALDGYYNVESAKATAKIASKIDKPSGYSESAAPSVPYDRPIPYVNGFSNTQLMVAGSVAALAVIYMVTK